VPQYVIDAPRRRRQGEGPVNPEREVRRVQITDDFEVAYIFNRNSFQFF
jgi:hypothetical protein